MAESRLRRFSRPVRPNAWFVPNAMLARVRLVLLLVLAGSARVAAAADVVAPDLAPAPLVAAARIDDAATVRQLLAAKPAVDVRQRSADGTTALHWAVYHDDVPLVETLIARGADVKVVNQYGSSPMSEAAVTGDVRVLKDLLAAGADVESPNADGQTALMVLARTSNVAAARLLLDHGARVDTRERWRQQTALMWAAAEAQPAMVKLLLAHGAHPDARSQVNDWERQVTVEPRMQARPSGGFTPLLYAARRGCVECARLLLEHGADVNLADPDGVSPLLLATLNFNFDTAALLVSRHANVNQWDLWGRSALYAAVDLDTLPVGGRADRPSADKTSSLDLVGLLLNAGANPNLQLKLMPPYRSLRDDRGADQLLGVGATPLLRAAKAGDVPAMKLLLEHGALVDLPTASGVTPLLAAAGDASSSIDTRGRYKTETQAVQAVDLLITHGADVNARDAAGETALFGAAQWGWNSLVRQLAAHNVDLMARDARGRTAVDVAMGSASSSGRFSTEPHPQTVTLLRQLMARAAPPVAAVTPVPGAP